MLRTLLDLALCIISSGCSSVSFLTSFNELVNTGVSLSSVSSSNKLNEPEAGGGHVAKSGRSCG